MLFSRKSTGFALVLFGSFALSACGGGGGDLSPQGACKQVMAAMCDKFYSCFSKEELAAAKDFVGTSRADCVKKQQAENCSASDSACDSGETFNSDKAKSCISGFKALTCNDLESEDIPTPAVCDQVCE